MTSSATATATMAAAGMDKRASTISSSSSLQTPSSATYPSEMRSPMAGSPGFKDGLKTPITPPSAYLDFLKQNMNSPALLSPAPTSTSAKFSFNEKPSSEQTGEKRAISPPTSQPSMSRNTSYDSNASNSTDSSVRSTASNFSSSSKTRPESPRIAIPPSPFARPGPRSARTPKRLHIPQSPAFSPVLPNSAHSANLASPYASTPLSAAPWSASFSPRSYHPDDPTNGPPGKVSVKQVVTRTVTYCRTPLGPAPKGKRRKIEEVVKEEDEPQVKLEAADETPRSPKPSPKPAPAEIVTEAPQQPEQQ